MKKSIVSTLETKGWVACDVIYEQPSKRTSRKDSSLAFIARSQFHVRAFLSFHCQGNDRKPAIKIFYGQTQDQL